jgi:hypothetical protein
MKTTTQVELPAKEIDTTQVNTIYYANSDNVPQIYIPTKAIKNDKVKTFVESLFDWKKLSRSKVGAFDDSKPSIKQAGAACWIVLQRNGSEVAKPAQAHGVISGDKRTLIISFNDNQKGPFNLKEIVRISFPKT